MAISFLRDEFISSVLSRFFGYSSNTENVVSELMYYGSVVLDGIKFDLKEPPDCEEAYIKISLMEYADISIKIMDAYDTTMGGWRGRVDLFRKLAEYIENVKLIKEYDSRNEKGRRLV